MADCAAADGAAAGTIVSCSANGFTRSRRLSNERASCARALAATVAAVVTMVLAQTPMTMILAPRRTQRPLILPVALGRAAPAPGCRRPGAFFCTA